MTGNRFEAAAGQVGMRYSTHDSRLYFFQRGKQLKENRKRPVGAASVKGKNTQHRNRSAFLFIYLFILSATEVAQGKTIRKNMALVQSRENEGKSEERSISEGVCLE